MGGVPVNLSSFRAISSGEHNMGDVRIAAAGGLEALNRFVFRHGKNRDYVTVQENIAVRNAFMKALEGDVRASGMIKAFQDVLLGENEVKTLTRDEIAACFKALDRRDATNLAETIKGLESRNVQPGDPLASVTSSRSVARRLSVNERLDVARCQTQRAAESFAKMTLAAAEVKAGGEGGKASAESAFESFKSALAQALSSAGTDDLQAVRTKIDAAFGGFDPCGDPADFPEALEAPLKTLLQELDDGVAKGAVRDLLETAVLRSPDSLAPSLVKTLSAEILKAHEDGADIPQSLSDVLSRRPDDQDASPAPAAPQPIDKPLGQKDVDDVGFVRDLCAELMARQPSVAHDECCRTVERCDRILATLDKTVAAHPADKKELEELAEQVRSRKTAEIRHRDNNPLSYQTVLTFFSKVVRAAEGVYGALVGQGNARKDCLNELRLDLGFFDGVTDYNADCPDAGSTVGGAMSAMAGRLKTVFAVHGLKVDKVQDRLEQAFYELLCKEPWDPLVSEFLTVLPSAGKDLPAETVKVKNVIQAFKDVDGFPDNVTYEDGINGVSCRMVKSKHATTGMNSQFFYKGRKIFNGVRTGVFCATGADEKDLEGFALNRARESVIAAVLANDGVMAELKANPQAVPSMLFTSTSLLTPDAFRGTFRSLDSDGNEKAMLKYQWQALNELNGQEIEVKVNGVTRKVKVDVLSFNFGVNKFAVGWRSPVFGGWDGKIDLRTGSETVRDHNRANVDLLATRVDAACARIDHEIQTAKGSVPPDLAKAGELQKRKENIRLLMRQLRSVIDAKGEGSSPEDTYKVGARINMLSFLIGGTPQWNCKSGKDRTGQLDVETKFLALLLASDRRIPEPGEVLSPEYRALLATIALEADSQNVQVLSAGLPGFKVNSSTVKDRLPNDPSVMKQYAAFKDHIDA